MAYYDEDGNEVTDVVSKAELEAKVEETRQALLKEKEDALVETRTQLSVLEKAQADAAAAVSAAAAGGGDDKEVNLVNLRKKLDETTSALEAERKQNEERYSMTVNERINQQINLVAGNDVELAKKIRHNFDTMLSGVKAETGEQLTQKVLSAAKLSVDVSENPNPLDIARMGGSRGAAPIINNQMAKPFSSVEISVGQKLGISDADRQKYGNDPRLNHKK